MAKRAFLTRKSLSSFYEVFVTEFQQSSVTGIINRLVKQEKSYKADLVVDKHPEYPDIPPSTWTVTLTIGGVNGDITQNVELKAVPQNLKNPSLVLVEWKIRTAQMGPGSDTKPASIGPDGFQRERTDPLKKLVVAYFDQGAVRHYSLTTDPRVYVSVSLTFIVEKTSPCRFLETLYASSLLTDCKLICGVRAFPAHRAILAAQSSVFTAMFQSDMKEKASGICTIKDIDPDVLDGLLQFVYTSELTKANGKLDSLWTAADKYDMQDLKEECERQMLGSVSDDNAFEYLCFARKRGLKKLQVEAAKILSQAPV